jgi:hypothetical protein
MRMRRCLVGRKPPRPWSSRSAQTTEDDWDRRSQQYLCAGTEQNKRLDDIIQAAKMNAVEDGLE